MSDTITLEELERSRLEARVALLEQQVRIVASMADGGIALKHVDPELHDKQLRDNVRAGVAVITVLLALLGVIGLVEWLS